MEILKIEKGKEVDSLELLIEGGRRTDFGSEGQIRAEKFGSLWRGGLRNGGGARFAPPTGERLGEQFPGCEMVLGEEIEECESFDGILGG
jgi:hypothetical protein